MQEGKRDEGEGGRRERGARREKEWEERVDTINERLSTIRAVATTAGQGGSGLAGTAEGKKPASRAATDKKTGRSTTSTEHGGLRRVVRNQHAPQRARAYYAMCTMRTLTVLMMVLCARAWRSAW